MDKTPERSIAVLSSHTPSLFWFRVDMMKEFQARGYKVYALGNEPSEKWADRFAELGITYRSISVKRNGMNPAQDRKSLKSIKDQLKDIMPDKIFTFQAKTVIYGTLAANSLGITEVYPLIAGMGSAFLSDSAKARIVRLILVNMYRRSMRKCPAVFFQNRDDERIFRDLGIIRNQRVVLLHGSGVNIQKFQPLTMPKKPAFICVSRLIRDKGVCEYLEASRRIKTEFPDVRCLLVGPYDTNPSALTEEELGAFIRAGIEYFGEQNDVRPFLEQASVLVLPSYREGTPKTNLEAMACGRAVITTDVPGCRETVIDGENGVLVPIKDSNAVYEKMKWFILHPERAAEMGRSGRKMAEDVFDVNRVNETICETMNI